MVKVLFLGFIFLAPLGLLAAFGLTRLARTARTQGDVAKALTLRARAAEKFWYTIVSTLLGLLGYWIVTRNLIPWLEPEFVLILFFLVLATMHFIIRHTLNVPKWKGWF
jgi:hypothetical protein